MLILNWHLLHLLKFIKTMFFAKKKTNVVQLLQESYQTLQKRIYPFSKKMFLNRYIKIKIKFAHFHRISSVENVFNVLYNLPLILNHNQSFECVECICIPSFDVVSSTVWILFEVSLEVFGFFFLPKIISKR